MDKEINGHLYIANDNLKRIADALDEILRLVKKDMEPRTKKEKADEGNFADGRWRELNTTT